MKRTTRLAALLLALVMVCSAVPFAASAEETMPEGTIANVGCSLNLEGAVHINQYVSVTGFPNVDVTENGGLLVFKSPVTEDEATYENADEVYAGLIASDGNYVQQTHGVPSKEYADELYLRVYVKDQYGRYVYGPVKPYSVQEYCEGRLEKSDSENMKNLAAAMLHYGAAAQQYFNHNLGDLANANILEAWPAVQWDSGLLTPLKDFTTDVESTGDVTVIGKTLSLEGAIKVNFYFQPVGWTAAGGELLVWDGVSEKLTADNASYTVQMKKGGNDWMGTTEEIVAKEMGKTIFAAARFVDTDGGVHYSDVMAYSPEAYAEGRINKSTNPKMVELAKKMVTYGEYAAIYFGVSEDKPSQPEATDKVEVSADVNVENGAVKDAVSMETETVKATVPSGVAVENGASQLTLSVQSMDETTGDITTGETEERTSLDIHVDGVAADNTTAIVVELGAILAPGLNKGNVALYHVENGVTNAMTQVDNETELDTHNEFHYDPVTGDVSVAMASFSEVAAVVDTTKAWKGEFDYSWYNDVAAPVAEGELEYKIANADQLAAFGAIVGGMDSQTQDSFAGKTVKLIADVNLGDKESENNPNLIFYPIGYYNSEYTYEKTQNAITSGFMTFEGTFDGNGHTIENFYQNTWEMKGDHNWYAPEEQYYRDGMGLFGKVYGGTVKNLTVKNFSSDGEIATTGVIAAYADLGASFENIAIFNCNPRVYNIGNGGIVGCVGWYTADETTDKVTFRNITVDNSNKISALWGSYDVACGGIVGQYYPTSGQNDSLKNAGIHFDNCHVTAQMDVYNDVCGNYQYYAYRYTGMLIGSIRENETVNGYVYPKMDGITAEDCTVHFGDWNDYYYCELVDNTTASYTHDHQMSRLQQVKDVNGTTITALDGTEFTVPTSGRCNYVVVNKTKDDGTFDHATENATCYHFLNGEVWTHDMAGIQTGVDEDKDGQDDLKEDKQHIYLEFNNLCTGYGWGVTSKGVGDLAGVTILDREEGSSVKKFESIADASYTTGTTVTVGELFRALENTGVELKGDQVQVAVSPVGEDSTAGGTFVANTTNWTQGTLTFSGIGKATITITDYYFCTPTTIEVTVTEKVAVEKFITKFDGEFLYRVGNQNTVALSSLFAATVDETDIGKVDVTVEAVEGSSASGTYTSNATWGNGTIQFKDTGVVKVTITDNDYCTPTELYLEVVKAYNVTQYSELKEQDSVLLQNITMSSGGTYRLTGGKVLYGNGFTFDVTAGAYAGVNYDYASYVIYLEDSDLDNVQIKGAVYPEVGATKTENYNRAIVMTSGNCKISNSCISNGASPIRNGGDLELINTTLKGGAYANLDMRNGHLILDNVTTVNQIGANDKYNNTTEIVGMGIVVYQEGGTEELKITIRNGLTQYNYLSNTQATEYFTDTYSKAIKNVVFGNDFKDYQNDGWINFGIISMNNYFTEDDLVDERTDKTGYFGKEKKVTLLSQERNCYVYSLLPGDTKPTWPAYKTTGQGVIAPSSSFDFVDKNYIAKTEDSNDYCYADGGAVYISMDEGDSFTWDTSILTATKCGNELNYAVSMDGVDYTGKSIVFNTTGTYTVVYAYEDPYNYCLDDGAIKKFAQSYTEELTIHVTVVKKAAKNAVFSFGANGTAYTAKTVQIGDKTYVMPNVTATVDSKIGSTTVSGTTVYYPITEMYTSDGTNEHSGSWYACFPIFKDAVQIIDYADQGTGDPVTYNQTKVTTVAGIPSTLKATNPTSAFLYSMNATNYPPPTDPTAVSGAVCYTCNRNGLTSSNTRKEENTVAEYTYTDNAGKVYYYYVGYHCAEQISGGSCVTGDSLITLADGTQKRVDQLTYQDELLVWDFWHGCYTTTTASVIFNHGDGVHKVTNLRFSDGTSVGVIGEHEFFDVDANSFVCITEENVAKYIGHSFVKANGADYSYVVLESYDYTEEEIGNYTVLTAKYNNAIIEGMFSLTPDPTHKCEDFFRLYEVGENMKFDEAKMQADIEKYGLFAYEDLADYVTYEEFVAFNGEFYKILVGKGLITVEDIVMALATYAPNH